MIFASDFRNGVTFEMSGEPCVVLEFQFVKPGKGATFVRTRYKNLERKKEVYNLYKNRIGESGFSKIVVIF